ncbi:MAG TPA: hypothetical protein VFB38_26455 [Chthonomonadaceae bacterium]|nr:hypothetical protein [Chthonomonadaceae bacterium]
MDEEHTKRCPHYQLYSEPLGLEGPPAYLAIRRCLLTERLIRLLRHSNDGALLAEKLVIHATNGKEFAFVGPDLEAVTQRSCLVGRCEKRCTPAYHQHLERFGLSDSGETEITCEDPEEEKDTSQDAPSSTTYV